MLFINNMYTCEEYAKHINTGSIYPIVLGRCKRRKKERERTKDKGKKKRKREEIYTWARSKEVEKQALDKQDRKQK